MVECFADSILEGIDGIIGFRKDNIYIEDLKDLVEGIENTYGAKGVALEFGLMWL